MEVSWIGYVIAYDVLKKLMRVFYVCNIFCRPSNKSKWNGHLKKSSLLFKQRMESFCKYLIMEWYLPLKSGSLIVNLFNYLLIVLIKETIALVAKHFLFLSPDGPPILMQANFLSF